MLYSALLKRNGDSCITWYINTIEKLLFYGIQLLIFYNVVYSCVLRKLLLSHITKEVVTLCVKELTGQTERLLWKCDSSFSPWCQLVASVIFKRELNDLCRHFSMSKMKMSHFNSAASTSIWLQIRICLIRKCDGSFLSLHAISQSAALFSCLY